MEIVTQDGMGIFLENCHLDEIIVTKSLFAIFGRRYKIIAISSPENIRESNSRVLGKYYSFEFANLLCNEILDKWKNGVEIFKMPIEDE